MPSTTPQTTWWSSAWNYQRSLRDERDIIAASLLEASGLLPSALLSAAALPLQVPVASLNIDLARQLVGSGRSSGSS